MDERKSLKLSPDRWRRLEELAAELQALAPPGQRTGQPSWRTLIRQIADGELLLARKEVQNDNPIQR